MLTVSYLHNRYVKDSLKKSVVLLAQTHLCDLAIMITEHLNIGASRVYLNTRVLKHLYDKRPAEEYDFMIKNLTDIIKFPHKIYENKNAKRGSFLFVKQYNCEECVVSLEMIHSEKENTNSHCEVVTFFRADKDYLLNYKLLWEWKGGTPSS